MNTFRVIKPPHRSPTIKSDHISIFLAGSIEMGNAEDWQTDFPYKISAGNKHLIIYNPRRDDWDSSWNQDINDANFYEQVTWELDHLEKSDIIAMYFDPNTKSPISLLELGIFARSGKLVICCPNGFWRKGNVDIVCSKYSIPVFSDYNTWIKEIERQIHIHNEI